MNNFSYGKVYFMVTYPDVAMAYPEIQSFVYLGKNLSDEDFDESWYFQPIDDFVRNGSALDPGSDIREALCITKDTIEAMLDDERMFEEVRRASSQRERQ